LKSDTVTVQQLFQNQLQYWVPFYQRAYTWKQGDQWAPLWDDVVRKADQRRVGVEPAPHFLGAVVLEPQVKGGFLGVDQLHIIDGQQRLTTLQFLLMGLKLALIDLGHSPDASQAVDACARNSNVETMKDPETETFKLWPTFRDREVFTKAMQVASLADLQPRFKEWFTAKGNLSKAVNSPPALGAIWYFATAAKEWMRQEGEDKLAAAGQAALAELKATLIARPDVRVLPGLLTFGIRTGPALLVKGARLRGIRVQQHAALLHQHANESPERPENRRCELSLHGLSPSTRPEHGSDCSRAQAEKGRSDASASRGWANNSGSTVKMRVVSLGMSLHHARKSRAAKPPRCEDLRSWQPLVASEPDIPVAAPDHQLAVPGSSKFLLPIPDGPP